MYHMLLVTWWVTKGEMCELVSVCLKCVFASRIIIDYRIVFSLNLGPTGKNIIYVIFLNSRFKDSLAENFHFNIWVCR